MPKLRVAITGATGLLGSNLLLEILKENLANLDSLSVILFGRQKGSRSLDSRVREIVLGEEGLAFLGIGNSESERVEGFLRESIFYIDYDLMEEKLGLNDQALAVLKASRIDFFFHVASVTDFRSTPTVEQALEQVIVNGTRGILNLIKECNVKEFIYVSTAYACGYKNGVLPPDVIDLNIKFRNPYEKRKLEAEVMVRELCRKEKIAFRIFRPSTICGRLIEGPFGAVTKFDVFYSWAAWFLRLKIKKGIPVKEVYNEEFHLPVRIACNSNSGLNIVPADFAAKAMYQTCIRSAKGESYYLVNNEETPHRNYFAWILNELKIKGAAFVDEIPIEQNEYEEFFYKTVGQIFTPYVNFQPMLFSTDSIQRVLSDSKVSCPRIDKHKFTQLMKYAKERHFGIKIKD